MPTVVLRSISTPKQISVNDTFNTVKPLSYREWLNNNIAIIPDDAERQYNNYLLSWYSTKNDTLNSIDNAENLRNDYLDLIKKLAIVFKNDEEFKRFTNIDFNDREQLSIAIPYYAKKLKQIALFISSKREDVKKAKLQHNLIGSEKA